MSKVSRMFFNSDCEDAKVVFRAKGEGATGVGIMRGSYWDHKDVEKRRAVFAFYKMSNDEGETISGDEMLVLKIEDIKQLAAALPKLLESGEIAEFLDLEKYEQTKKEAEIKKRRREARTRAWGALG